MPILYLFCASDFHTILAIYGGLPLAGAAIAIIEKKTAIARSLVTIAIFLADFMIFILMVISASSYIPMDMYYAMYWFPLIVCGGVFLILMMLVWGAFKPKARMIAVMSLIVAIVATTGSLYGVAKYKEKFIEINDSESEIDLMQYIPFPIDAYGKTLVKTLDEPPTLAFSDNLPRLDGATALYPLYSAFARATYPEGEYSPYGSLPKLTSNEENASPVVCSKTSEAFENLVDGYADIAFLMDVSEEQAAIASEQGLELEMTPIGKEAFVFMVNSENEIEDLSQSQVRGIYAGDIRNWREVGGPSAIIEAYQRQENSGSQTELKKIMGSSRIREPKKEQVYSMMFGMYNAIASYKNYKNAIGYSFRFYIESMLNDAELKQVKLLRIDGIAPNVLSIASGEYPFAESFYAVTARNREPADDDERARRENAKRLIDWILSAQGQELVEKTGYVAIR
jgi:phosphate transport system substrate-binding protein